MADLRLRLVCRAYDRVLALRSGEIRPRGIELAFETGLATDILDRISRGDADLGESSIGQYTVRRSRGVDDITAIPVFPLRMFRQGDVFVRRDAGLTDMAQLRGRRVGVEGYALSSNVWLRGILQHQFSVPPGEVEWFQGPADPGKTARTMPPNEVPPGIRLTTIPQGRTLGAMLRDRELDAVVPSWPLEDYRPGGEIDRMYPDYPAEDRRFYRATGIWPIQHLIVVHRRIVDQHPWIVESLVSAFDDATRLWKTHIQEHHCMFPWAQRELHEMEQLFGADFYGNGLVGNNGRNVQAFLTYAHEQGVAARRVGIEEFFASGVA